VFVPDTTPPVITPTVTGTQGNNGFYTSNVAVSWNVSDPESVITSLTGCGATTISVDTAGTTLTCTAVSGGGSANQSVTVKRDATAPTLIFAAPTTNPNAAGWYNANVSITYAASDNVSGVSASTPSGTLIISNEGNAVTGSVTITDNAGNSQTFTTTAVKIDKTPPVFASISGNTVDLNSITTDPSVVTAAVNYAVLTTDNLDAAPLVNCSPVSGGTFQLGSTNVSCGATDAAGNAATKVFQVNVLKTVTAAGTNIAVAPAPNLNLNFSNVSGAPPGTQAGVTVATPLTQTEAQPLPANFSVIGSPILYDITTTAAFSGNVTVTFDVPNIGNPATCSQLRILHFTNGNWESTNNAAPIYNAGARTCTVSQTVTSLSPFAVATVNGTTAASVLVGGRVLTREGRAIRNASITMTDSDGELRTASTDENGNYQFTDVQVGGTYIFSVRAKNYNFIQTAQVININAEVTDINFIGIGSRRRK
jgi:Carboxypeptidase regulatory-like domain/HYR domain